MFFPSIYYKEPVYRPPSEAKSLLIQFTEGCSYNCRFCIGNEGKDFLFRPLSDIKKDIDVAKDYYGNRVKKVFLLDGNAFVAKTDNIIDVSAYCYDSFQKLIRVSAYAHARDILEKSDEELKMIRQAGFKMVYLGIETGDNDLLTNINKKITSQEIIEAAHKLYRADITLSATIILGLAGNNKELSYQHIVKTADLINKIKPEHDKSWYISALTLMIPPGTPLYEDKTRGAFSPMSAEGILKELKLLLENLDDDLNKCIFRANHASNYLDLESNNLARNRLKLISQVEEAIKDPARIKNECFRGL